MSEAPATRAWSSGLSTNDFAASVEAGLEPLGFVQGCSVISWNWYAAGSPFSGFGQSSGYQHSGYYEQFPCPHGYVSMEHRSFGANYEQVPVNDAWSAGFSAALERLVAEARELGAHGVIGVIQRSERWGEVGAYQFALQGTAVAVPGTPRPEHPFTTTLAGQKLNKLLEAGFAPVAIVASLVSVQVYASCITEYQLRGSQATLWGAAMGGEIVQLSRAYAGARELARRHIRNQLRGDTLHGAHCRSSTYEVGGLGPAVEVSIFGNRVRRFKDFDPLELPRPVVNLADG